MSSYGELWVGSALVGGLQDGVGNELLAMFRDDMMNRDFLPDPPGQKSRGREVLAGLRIPVMRILARS
jgi:hypothetical protein